MANVYLARDMILDRDVAVKILRLDFAHEEEFIRRFQREAQSATSLAHPNIVSIYDVGEEEDIYYIVMEFVDGMTLKQYIQEFYPISVEKALDIMQQLTSAVTHAHQNHIVHRDIKPQNILIDRDGVVKITDFGIAMALSATSITQTNAVLGSVHYLSPEQARGGMATKKSDIYSLGIVLFELLTGRLPFSGESAVSIALKHLQSETPSPSRWNPDIPQSVENIVLKATAKDPFLRYESAEQMEADLESALDPERLDEPKFIVPEDMDATKAIPVITNEQQYGNLEETVIRDKEKPGAEAKPAKGKGKKKRKKWPWIIGSAAALLVLFVLFVMFLLPRMLASDTVTVPDVTGLTYDEAVAAFSEKGLKVGEKLELPSDEFEEGETIKTNPEAGDSVKKGSLISMYISTGKEKLTIDDYTGRQYDEVVDLLKKLGFQHIRKEEVHDEAPAGTIIEQSPRSGDSVVPADTDMVFTVSLGEEKITLKDLKDYNAKGLEEYAGSTGLKINVSAEEYSSQIAKGSVISQSPAAGTQLSKGDRVNVVISKGPESIPPKSVFKEIVIPYGDDEEEDGDNEPQEVKIFIQDMNYSMNVPAEIFTITSTVKKQLHFQIAKGQKAAYKVIRNNTVILEDEISYPGE